MNSSSRVLLYIILIYLHHIRDPALHQVTVHLAFLSTCIVWGSYEPKFTLSYSEQFYSTVHRAWNNAYIPILGVFIYAELSFILLNFIFRDVQAYIAHIEEMTRNIWNCTLQQSQPTLELWRMFRAPCLIDTFETLNERSPFWQHRIAQQMKKK